MSQALAAFLALTTDGIAYGMMLFLISVGLTITLGVMRVVNLSHSAFAMIGGYFALLFAQKLGVHFYLAVPLAVIAAIVVGGLIERTLFRWVYKANSLGQLLMTLGLTFIITAVAKNVAGTQLQALSLPVSLQGNFYVGPLTLSVYRSFLIITSAVVALALWLGLERTSFGARLRASVDNRRMAGCVGINVPLVFSITFAVGCGLAALGGALGSPILPLEPYYGLKYLVLVLIVVAVGGVGSIRGSLMAGLLLGLIDTWGRYYVPALGAFIIYLAVLAILLVRPKGLVS